MLNEASWPSWRYVNLDRLIVPASGSDEISGNDDDGIAQNATSDVIGRPCKRQFHASSVAEELAKNGASKSRRLERSSLIQVARIE